MTVSTTVSQIEYAGDGLVVAFPTTFKFLANGDVTVVLRSSAGIETTLVETTHYTLTGALGETGGTVTMITAPASSEVLAIKRVTAKTQGADYVENDPFPAETHETALDRLTLIAQEGDNGIDRAITAPISDTDPDMELPIASARANKFAAFDANGDVTTSNGSGTDTGLRTDLAETTLAGTNGFHLVAYPLIAGEVGVVSHQYDYNDVFRYMSRAEILDVSAGTLLVDVTTALQAAATAGKAIKLRDGSYKITSPIDLAEGSEFHGSRAAIIQAFTDDQFGFTATGLNYFRLSGFTLKGLAASLGAVAGGAITVVSCLDFDVQEMLIEDWMAGGVHCTGASGSKTHGNVINNHFVKGSVTGTTTGYGVQDNAPVQVYDYCDTVRILDNKIEGDWYCAVIVQDRIGSGASRIFDITCSDNYAEGMSNYGIVMYTLSQNITAIADNGSGLFRVTVAGHDCTTGDIVCLESCGVANGIWEITVIDADNYDLNNSVYAAASAGAMRMSENCAGVYANNIIKGVQGTRENPPGSNPYGMGFYLQAVGGISMVNNQMLDCCQLTNAETLTVGGLGLNGATGPVNVIGGQVADSGYNGIDCSNTQSGTFTVVGVTVVRSAQREVFLDNSDNIDMSDITIIPAKQSSLSSNSCVMVQNADNVHLDRFRLLNITQQTRVIHFDTVTNFSVTNCKVVNASPATVACELAYFEDSVDGEIIGNNFNGALSAYTALTLLGCTYTLVDANKIFMTPDGAARPVVSMTGTCTGSIYNNTNYDYDSRMHNGSTGGAMHTRASSDQSGGKTRQIGDTIIKTNPVTSGVIMHVKIVASAAGADWEDVSFAP